ncbi:MAG TPA: hypothetical protein VGB85_26010 [Nannocystis sp.]
MTGPAPRLRDRLCVAAVLLAWHLPVVYHGLVSARPLPGVPWNLHRCHDITCLFDDKPVARHHYYVQVRRIGRPDWQTLDVSELSPMVPFGYRSRIERLLTMWGEKSGLAHRELASWLFRRHRELHPEQPQLTELRFLWTWVLLGEDPLPQGAARPPPAESFPFDRKRVLSVHLPEDR